MEIISSKNLKTICWSNILHFQDGDNSDNEYDSDASDDDEGEETALEGFTTPLDEENNPEYVDEYIIFSNVMRGKTTLTECLCERPWTQSWPWTWNFTELPQQDPSWFQMISANLTDQQRKSIQTILTTAEQKKNLKRSNEIEKSGGELRICKIESGKLIDNNQTFKQDSNSLTKRSQQLSTSAVHHQTKVFLIIGYYYDTKMLNLMI